MNYEKMSDIKINTLVGMHIGKKIASSYECLKTGACFEFVGDTPEISPFNPCNNPSDAWQIIMENGISLIDPELCGSIPDWCAVKFIPRYGAKNVEVYHKNPLRAAMIVFLMMQEAKRG